MIINALYDYYYSKKRKRGYEVISLKWILIFIAILLLMGIVASQLILTGDWWLSITFIILYVILKVVSKKIDVILEKASLEATPKAKKIIFDFLQEAYKFEKPKPFIELASQLQTKAEKNKKNFDLTPYINMILPVFVLILSLMVQSSPETLPEVLMLAIIVLTVSLSINPTMNIFSDIFLNSKYEKIMELSILVREIYLDELAKESNCNEKTHENVQVIKIDVFFNN